MTLEDRAAARAALLTLLSRQANSSRADPLAKAVIWFAVTPDDQASVRAALLNHLAETSQPWNASELAEALARLDPSPEDRAAARATLLTLLTRQTDAGSAAGLARSASLLDLAPEDRAAARKTLLALAHEAKSWRAQLADAVARMTVMATDLGGWDTGLFPPTVELLAAVRRNSKISDWLAALPLLSLHPLEPQTGRTAQRHSK